MNVQAGDTPATSFPYLHPGRRRIETGSSRWLDGGQDLANFAEVIRGVRDNAEGSTDHHLVPRLVGGDEALQAVIGCSQAIDQVLPLGVGYRANGPRRFPVDPDVLAGGGVGGDGIKVEANVVDLGRNVAAARTERPRRRFRRNAGQGLKIESPLSRK